MPDSNDPDSEERWQQTVTDVFEAVVDGHQYVEDIADATGLHQETVREKLNRLSRYGYVRGRWAGKNKGKEWLLTKVGERMAERILHEEKEWMRKEDYIECVLGALQIDAELTQDGLSADGWRQLYQEVCATS